MKSVGSRYHTRRYLGAALLFVLMTVSHSSSGMLQLQCSCVFLWGNLHGLVMNL